jgi:hypothetical protein
MPIGRPGPRLLRSVALDFVRRRREFASRHAVASAGRLSLTSMIDCMVVVVAFLLMGFSASGECGCRRPVDVPFAGSGSDMIDAPLVTVTGTEILVDGVPAGDPAAVVAARRPQRIDALFNLMRSKKELWRRMRPQGEFPGVVVLEIDGDMPSLIVKSVFQTCVFAGYPSVSFMVRRLDSTRTLR